MHILVIAAAYPNSYRQTSGIFFKEQAEALSKAGHTVGLISVNFISVKYILSKKKIDFPSYCGELNKVNTIVNHFPVLPKFRHLRLKLKFTLGKKLFKKYIRKYGMPDIIHQHTYEDGLLTNFIKSKYSIPYVLTEHYTHFFRGIVKGRIEQIARKSYKNSSFNMCVGEKLRTTLESHFQMPFTFVPNLINTGRFVPAKNKKKSERIDFISIGGLIRRKNFDNLIRAFSTLMKNNSKLHLTIAGEGEEKARLKKLIKSFGLEEQITLYGQAKRNEVLNLLQQSDFFIMSSGSETFGVVLIEAMSCGLPVISVKNGGAENIIKNENVGILCEASPESLRNAVLKIQEKNYDSEYIRNYIIENFSETAVTKQWINIYKKVLQEQSL